MKKISLLCLVALVGKKENLDMKAIENLGEFKEVTLEEIFGY
jgi:hypothetical protein